MRHAAGRWALLLTLLGLALRLIGLAHLGDLEFDEIVSVRYASVPPAELVPRLAAALFEHPPLFYVLLGWWRAFAGDSDVLARLFSVLPGTLLIPLGYAAGRRLFGARAGLATAALLTVSPLPLFYSREARMYSLVTCLALVSCWLYVRALSRRRGAGHWAGHGLLSAAAALVHYAGLLAVLAQVVAAAASRGATARRLRPAVGVLGIVILLALAVAGGSSGVRGSLPALDVAYVPAVPGALWHAWRELAAGPETDGMAAVLAGTALVALVALGMPRRATVRFVLVASLAAGLLAVGAAVLLGKPVQARYLLVGAPFVYLAAGAAADRRTRLAIPLLGIVLMCGTLPFLARYYGGYQRADYSAITQRVAALERPGDAILLTGPWQAWYFDYYYRGALLHAVLPADAPPALDPARARRELDVLTEPRRRLWFIQAGLAQADPTNFVERWLQRRAWPALREARQNAVLHLYALEEPDTRRSLRPVDFGDVLRLSAGWVDGEEVPASDVARLWLEFEALRPLPANYKASLRLVGADGQRLASDFDVLALDPLDEAGNGAERITAAWRPGERHGMRRGVWLPVSTNPQPYDVRLVVYDPATLAPLVPTAVNGVPLVAAPGGEAPLGGMYVTQSRAAVPPVAGAYRPLDRTFGGGDEFDSIHLSGARWLQEDAGAAPLSLDLLWRLEGRSGTLHRSQLALVDTAGRVWIDETRPLFAGAFYMRDWRERETVGERRTVDARSLPPGRYTLLVRLYDERGRQLPVQGSPVAGHSPAPHTAPSVSVGTAGAVELHRLELPYRRPFSQRVQGLLARLRAWLP